MATPESVADTLAPLLHWRLCNVYDWLWYDAHKLGFPTRMIAEAYGHNDEGSPLEINARTGCVGCNLASRDTALEAVLKLDQWAYLAPLKRLRPLYALLTEHRNRLRKDGTELRADGTLVKNPGRVGPLLLTARRWGLDRVLEIQEAVNSVARLNGRPEVVLINDVELQRIRELIDAGTWPNGWSGDELTGDVDVPDFYGDGTMQGLLFGN